jgi:acyl-coenzyme A synthetase/AMP-(fatty) acid ligase
LVTSPLQVRAMLEMTGAAQFPDMVISATAPLDAQLAAQTEARWGTRVMEIFGATEVGSVASRRTVTDESWLVYPGVSLSGEDGPLVSADGAATRRMNDVVTLLDGGTRFRLIGRCGDWVKLGGRRASLAGLSRILLDIDGVSDGTFVAPDDLEKNSTARLVALMVSDVLSAADVLAALRTRMDPVFLPRPLLHVPALPRNELGKLPRDALLPVLAQARDMAARGLAAFAS